MCGSASAISPKGKITGGIPDNFNGTAFLWDNGSLQEFNLGYWGLGVNDAGTVVAGQGPVWNSGGSIRLPPIPGDSLSVGSAINDAGTIVGSSVLPPPDYRSRAVVWYSTAAASDFIRLVNNNYGMLLTGASAISAAGDIVGTATVGGVTHAFLAAAPV